MTTQLTFSADAPYNKGSDTSRSAAESIQPVLSKMELQVYQHIAKQGRNGATCDEIEVALNFRHQTASARVNGLAKKARVADSKARRRTRSNRPAVVWVLACYT